MAQWFLTKRNLEFPAFTDDKLKEKPTYVHIDCHTVEGPFPSWLTRQDHPLFLSVCTGPIIIIIYIKFKIDIH